MTVKTNIFKKLGTGIAAGLVVLLSVSPANVFAASSHDINAWQTGTALPDARFAAASTSYNGYAYEMGGYKGGVYYNTTYYAKLNANGSVGSWQTGTPLPTNVDQQTVVGYNGYLYSIGGYNATGNIVYNTTYYAKLNADGSLGNWQATATLPQNLMDAAEVVNNGYLYQFGGYNGSLNVSSVYYAKFNADGTLGSWQTTTSLPSTIAVATAEAGNGNAYVIGGVNGSSLSSVYYASFNSNGTIGSWQTTSALPQPRQLATSAVYNGYLYEFGGSNGGISNTIYYAKINTDGTLGAWQTSATTLPQSLHWGTSVINNSFVYLLGGMDGVTASTLVSYARIEGVTSATLGNAADSQTVALATPAGSDITCSQALSVSSQSVQDGNYSYPLGLVAFCFNTTTANNQVTLTFVTSLQPNAVVARHYNRNTQQYTAINGAAITATTYGGQPALQLTYSLADNGSMDEDATVGAITDPVGLAVANPVVTSGSVAVPNTGLDARSSLLPTLAITGGSVIIIVFAVRFTQSSHGKKPKTAAHNSRR